MKYKTNKDVKKHFKLKVDNKLRAYGETDFEKKTIRVNKKKNRKSPRPGELLDTIVHEVAHVKHPKMKEKNIRKHAAKLIESMSRKRKQKYYNLFGKRG